MRVDQQTTQNEDKIHGAAMQICFLLRRHLFLKIDQQFYKT